MPVEISYLPRPSILSVPAICVSFVLRSMAAVLMAARLDLIDVVENGDGVLGLEQRDQLGVARMVPGAAMPMNGTPAALAQRASSTVSPTYQSFSSGMQRLRSRSSPRARACRSRRRRLQMIGSKRSSEAKRCSVDSASCGSRPVKIASR